MSWQYYLVIPEANKLSKTTWVVSKELRGHLEEAPTGQRWDNSNFNKNINSNGLKRIKMNQSMNL